MNLYINILFHDLLTNLLNTPFIKLDRNFVNRYYITFWICKLSHKVYNNSIREKANLRKKTEPQKIELLQENVSMIFFYSLLVLSID